MHGTFYQSQGHGLRDCPDDTARIEALEGELTKYGSWLRAASIEQSKSKHSRPNTKSPGKTLSSSTLENHSEKNSGTGRSSENNSNDHADPHRQTNELILVPNKELDKGRGNVEGLLQVSKPQLGSTNSIHIEGATSQAIVQNVAIQHKRDLARETDRDMEMTDSVNVSFSTQGIQADNSEVVGTSSKTGIRRWKRVARSMHKVSDQDSFQVDRKLELGDSHGFESPQSSNCGTDGSGKRKMLSISPGDIPKTKKLTEIDIVDPILPTAEPGNQARREQ
ncbi:hypothetical protein Q3G72_006983 [Acer saccharum]|nr:hypothetical protein Q3G72_006983 [Acer saccharum]